MNSNPVDLRRVHWYEGLFLKPEHFRRQDEFAESLALWNARYGTSLFGVIGTGPRQANDPADAFSFNRVSVVAQNGSTSAAVERVRGLTPAGAWIEVPSVLRAEIPTPDPGGDALLYVVRRRTADGFTVVPSGPSAAGDEAIDLAEAAYELTTRPAADDIPWSLVVSRLRRNGDIVERDDTFIPACAFISSHVALTDRAARVRDLAVTLERGYVALYAQLREITGLARRAAVEVSEDYEDMLGAVAAIADAIGDTAFVLGNPHAAVPQFIGALGLLASRTARALRMAPSVDAYLSRTALALPWDDLRRHTDEPIRSDENLALRLDAADRLAAVLDGIRSRAAERCDDYRVHRRYRELQLAVDTTVAPKRLYTRVAGPVGVEAVSSDDVRFRFTNLSLDPRRSYIAILFGAGDEPLADRDYIGDVYVNDREQRRDIAAPTRHVPSQANIAVPVEGHGEPIRSVVIKIPGGGPFGGAALYTLATAQSAVAMRQESATVRDSPPPEYVTLNLTGHKADRVGKVELAGSDQVRVRMRFDRPAERGGKGGRRLFEVAIRKGNVWSFSLSPRDRDDPRLVCRWNDSGSMIGMKATYDFPEMPDGMQLGIADGPRGAKWFLRCRFKHIREPRPGGVEDIVAARLEEITGDWPTT